MVEIKKTLAVKIKVLSADKPVSTFMMDMKFVMYGII